MLLFCIAALAAFMLLAHRRAEEIRLRRARQLASIPQGSWEAWNCLPRQRRVHQDWWWRQPQDVSDRS